tara:strand:+ start:356 stop:676 length:321 start_codon:yes stop_codon:yes gene_type:complete
MNDEYIKALEHWARCFREGVYSNRFADEIAYLLEDKAHDLKMDHPEEKEQVLQRWRVVVEQRNVFYEEAETAEEARRIAVEDRIWDEHQSGEDTYGFDITVEPDDD